MSKPEDPFDLIRWDEGAPRFNAKQGGLTGFWDHYNEARLFFLVCAQPKVEETDYIAKAQLHPFIGSMLNDIPASWRKALPHAVHWNGFHHSQARAAMERQRMGLIKALQAAVLIEHYLADRGVDTSDYYKDIYIKPATYKVVTEEGRVAPQAADPLLQNLALLGQPFPNRILSGHGGGDHVCYSVAREIAGITPGATIDFARRAGERGATKPACKALLYQCV